MALDLGREAGATVADHARANGLLLNSPRPDSLRFMPALTVSADEIERMLAGLDGALKSVLA
jgi:acetylornithine/N-succinyldiaminopimelate aminotransferase